MILASGGSTNMSGYTQNIRLFYNSILDFNPGSSGGGVSLPAQRFSLFSHYIFVEKQINNIGAGWF